MESAKSRERCVEYVRKRGVNLDVETRGRIKGTKRTEKGTSLILTKWARSDNGEA